MKLDMFIQLMQGHEWFGLGDRIVDGKVSTQPVAVFHQDVPPKTELGFFTLGPAVEHALRIGGALVGVIAALFAMKADRGIARIVLFALLDLLPIATVLAHQAFEAGPSLDQRAVPAEMGVADPPLGPRQVIHFDKEQFGHLLRQ